MIKLRNLEDKDKELYVLACRQEPGCENAFTEPIFMDMIWKIATEGTKETYVITDETEIFMGYISLDTDDIPEIGISFLPEFQRKGYGEKAFELLMQKAHEEKGISIFSARVDPSNEHCIKMLEKLNAKRVDSRPSTFMKSLAEKPDDDGFKSLEMEVMEHFNNNIYRYDIEFSPK